MKKSGIFLLSTTVFLLGTIVGFMAAPAKKSIFRGSNNGINECGEDDCFCDDLDLQGDEDDMPF